MENDVITRIREAVARGDYRYTIHALQRTTERHISRAEIEQAIANAEIIEDYPLDKYGPSVLLYGEAKTKKVLHIQVSVSSLVKIITAYEPDPNQWENNRVRKSHE